MTCLGRVEISNDELDLVVGVILVEVEHGDVGLLLQESLNQVLAQEAAPADHHTLLSLEQKGRGGGNSERWCRKGNSKSQVPHLERRCHYPGEFKRSCNGGVQAEGGTGQQKGKEGRRRKKTKKKSCGFLKKKKIA